ncbi:hypothetical protein B0H13DRAFT_2676202 [Mycena leptocephala]|nr:hypothetical protein B0H13DRAFT_2676202 [Mycena leptocephala]
MKVKSVRARHDLWQRVYRKPAIKARDASISDHTRLFTCHNRPLPSAATSAPIRHPENCNLSPPPMALRHTPTRTPRDAVPLSDSFQGVEVHSRCADALAVCSSRIGDSSGPTPPKASPSLPARSVTRARPAPLRTGAPSGVPHTAPALTTETPGVSLNSVSPEATPPEGYLATHAEIEREHQEFLRNLRIEPDADFDDGSAPPALMQDRCNTEFKGDIFHADCAMSDLLPAYLDGRDPLASDNPECDLDALHGRHFLRRSMRKRCETEKARSALAAACATRSLRSTTPRHSCPPASHGVPGPRIQKRPRPITPASVVSQPPKRNRSGLTKTASSLLQTPIGEPPIMSPPSAPPKATASLSPQFPSFAPPCRLHPVTRFYVNYLWTRSSSCPSPYQESASWAAPRSGWCGVAPPKGPRGEIDRGYSAQPDARGLHRHIRYFYPASYTKKTNLKEERATFFVDRDGTIFMYRSYRVAFLMERAAEVEHAHNVLVGDDLSSPSVENKYWGGTRGDHMAIIIGHQRQSATRPRLTAWHEKHADRVDAFLDLPIVKAIIGLVSDIVRTIFPGVAARFTADAEWHRERYGIEPLFGLFWNLCLNAWFRGQKRIHCKPHADMKNQLGVCVLLIYILKCGKNFNHSQRTWLVIWEAGVVLELPPWTIAIYPSALFYHFNIDVHEIEFVTTDGNVRPTRENSTPIVDGDECGRGSFVFYNQSTMSQGPALGFDTVAMAQASGLSGKSDFGTSAQEAFERHVVFKCISPDVAL